MPDPFRDRIVEGIESGTWQSVAVGLVQQGETTSEFFGHLEGTDGLALDGHSRVELGPLSEAFVGLLLADLVIAGKARLSDTLADVLPENFTFTDSAVGGLSLEKLATFHSGLPPVPPNLFPRSERDPFVDYDTTALQTLLAHVRAQGDGSGGVLDGALLGYALEQRTKGDVAALVRSRIITELGLEHTGFGDGDLVAGHHLGEIASPWHFSALAPARGLRSDLDDQLKFAQALLRPVDGPLQAALLLARQPRGDAALGWHVLTVRTGDQEWPVLWNGGSSGGHASFLGLRADRQQAVVLLGNSSTDLSAFGLALLTDAAPPVLLPHLRRLDAAKAGEYSGLYRFDAKDEVIVRPDNEGLTLQQKGQFPLQVVAYDEDAFLFVGANAQVTFQRDSARHVESLLLHQGGMNLAALRLSERAPRLAREAAAPIADQPVACIGDFALSDLMQLRLAQQGNGLSWQLSGGVPQALVAFAAQRYSSADGALEVRCNVDDKGQVVSAKLNLAGSEIDVPRVRWDAASEVPQAGISGISQVKK